MKRTLLPIAAVMLVVIALITSCSNSKNQMIGLWKVENVDAQFDESRVNPQTLEQVIASEKQTLLKFVDDSTLTIMLGETNMKAFYTLDESNKLFYYFEGAPTQVYELGTLTNNKIEAESTTPVGKIKVTYQKSAK